MDTSPASLSSPCKDYIIAGNLKSGTQETWDDITFDPAEAKCSTAKTLEKELNDIQANLVFHTTSSSAASDNEFMNQEAEETWMSGPGEDSTLQNSLWHQTERNETVFEERSKEDFEEEVSKEKVNKEVMELDIKKEAIMVEALFKK